MKLSQKHTLTSDKKLTKVLTKSQLAKIKEYWGVLKLIESEYFEKCNLLEDRMRADKEIGIKDIIFHWVDGNPVGVGNETRKMKLLQENELEDYPRQRIAKS